MAEEMAIRVNNVSKNFKLPHERVGSIKNLFTNPFRKGKTVEVQHALHNVSFEIKKGEFFGIVGRNGSGKSTLLKMLAGIYQPSKGEINTSGKLVPFIELGVGFNPELTGRENVYLNGAMLGFSKPEIDSMYDDIVNFAELERFMDQKLKNYSSGMQVRLAFSMATRSEADILLVDEVLAVGDAEFQRKCFDYFRTLKKNKKTVVFVSHDMNAVREYCERAVLIDKSKIVTMGDSSKVAKEYLRLFNPVEYEQESKVEKNGDKWGNGTVEIKEIRMQKKHFTRDDKYINFSLKVVAHADFESSIVPGISIKNGAGQPICGTNSMLEQIKVPSLSKNQEVVFNWKVRNIFNDDIYTIEPAIADAKDMSICQWWDNAATFEVTNEKKTPYLVAPNIELSWKI